MPGSAFYLHTGGRKANGLLFVKERQGGQKLLPTRGQKLAVASGWAECKINDAGRLDIYSTLWLQYIEDLSRTNL